MRVTDNLHSGPEGALADCDKALLINPRYMKAFFERIPRAWVYPGPVKLRARATAEHWYIPDPGENTGVVCTRKPDIPPQVQVPGTTWTRKQSGLLACAPG